MKNALIILIVVVAAALMFTNCKKEDLVVCAKCVELTLQDTLDDFCGPKVSVDQWVNTLQTTGSAAGLNYSCTVK